MGRDIFGYLMVPCMFVGAYFIASAICQRVWKEKIPQKKLLGFTSIFVISQIALFAAGVVANLAIFGR